MVCKLVWVCKTRNIARIFQSTVVSDVQLLSLDMLLPFGLELMVDL